MFFDFTIYQKIKGGTQYNKQRFGPTMQFPEGLEDSPFNPIPTRLCPWYTVVVIRVIPA